MKRKLPNSIDCFISERTEFESHNDRYYDMYSLLCDLEKCGHIHFCEHGFTYDHVYEEDNTETYGSRPSFNRIESKRQTHDHKGRAIERDEYGNILHDIDDVLSYEEFFETKKRFN